MNSENSAAAKGGCLLIALAGLILALIIAFFSFAGPHYEVWTNEMKGKAELSRAQSNRTIAVLEAQAKQEAAKSLAKAEAERAKGAAVAIREVGRALEENPNYLRYRWVEGLNDGSGEVIYVPTEAGMPILEAGKRK